MPPDSKADLAHPEAADWVLGTMGPVQAEDFPRHLTSCLHCQAAVAEFGELGQMLQHLPPAAEPPPGLEARTIASVLAAAAKYPTPKADRRSDPEDQAATRVQPRPQLQPPAGDETRVQPRPQLQPPAGDETRVQPRPQLQPPAGDETRVQPRPQLQPPAGDETRPTVTRLPVWRRHQGRLAAVVAVAAAIITAAIVVPLSLGGGRITPAQATAVIPLHATTAAKESGYGAATGRATARQDASGSWDITLTVQHLRSFGDNQWYECWYVSQKLGQVAPAGSFQVPASGNRTFHMTSAVDPRDFPLMEITLGPPSSNGAKPSKVVLSGQTL